MLVKERFRVSRATWLLLKEVWLNASLLGFVQMVGHFEISMAVLKDNTILLHKVV